LEGYIHIPPTAGDEEKKSIQERRQIQQEDSMVGGKRAGPWSQTKGRGEFSAVDVGFRQQCRTYKRDLRNCGNKMQRKIGIGIGIDRRCALRIGPVDERRGRREERRAMFIGAGQAT
jgi:hypothetical protein